MKTLLVFLNALLISSSVLAADAPFIRTDGVYKAIKGEKSCNWLVSQSNDLKKLIVDHYGACNAPTAFYSWIESANKFVDGDYSIEVFNDVTLIFGDGVVFRLYKN